MSIVILGADGPSQMGLEDIAMIRSIPNSVVFYPSDGVSTFKIAEVSKQKNIHSSLSKTDFIKNVLTFSEIFDS